MRAQHEWEVSMPFTRLKQLAGFIALTLLLSSAAWAQTPDQQTTMPDRSKLRQPTPSSVQQVESPADAESKRQSETDRKLREADRKLNRAMRSICNGC
jgi:hypothetical protein